MLDISVALSASFDEVHYIDFYRDLFPVGSFEQKGIYESGKYNGIAVAISPGQKQAKRFTVTDDLNVIADMAQTDDFCLMSPISYAGKSRKSENARFMYALVIDLDGIETLSQWQFFMQQIERGHEMLSFVWGLPKPTYLVASGNGVHIYYVFENPIPLFRNIVEQLEVLKKRLTWQAWTQGASSLHDNVQYESLFQGFRVVGTITKNGTRCRAFKVGDKVDIAYLNRFVPEEHRVQSLVYKSDLSLAEAREKYPEWYQRRVVEGRPKKTWTCKKALYDWWIRILSAGAEQGHRYWCIMTLATYAKKCGVPRDVLESDAYSLIPLMNTKGDEFTEDDVLHALEAYEDSYITYPIKTIVNRTGIPIERNKRNGRKQWVHLQGARAIQEINDRANGTNWRAGNGRPSAQKQVAEWRERHPEGTKSQCKTETGLSYPTIRKWWDCPPIASVNVSDVSYEESKNIAQSIMAACEKIAAERGISPEKAYELYQQNPKNVRLVKSVPKVERERAELQKTADNLIFSEHEFLSLPESVRRKLQLLGVHVRVVPDDQYASVMLDEYLKSLNEK